MPVLGRGLGDRPDRADDAGIVDHDVQPAEARHGEVDRGGDVGLGSDIGADERGPVTEFGRQTGAGPLLHVAKHHLGAVLMEQPRGSRADAAGAAGDHRDLVLEPVAHARFFPGRQDWT